MAINDALLPVDYLERLSGRSSTRTSERSAEYERTEQSTATGFASSLRAVRAA